MITIDEIREKIIIEIKNSGLTQTAIAKQLGIKQPTVGQYLTGRAMPALDTFANLCVILDLDANDILGINKATRKKAININNSFNLNSGNVTINN